MLIDIRVYQIGKKSNSILNFARSYFSVVEYCGGFGPGSDISKTYVPCSRHVNEACDHVWEQEEEVACKTWYTWAPDCKTET